MKLCCAMLVGPGEAARYLDRVLRYATSWCDVLAVYADGADDDSRQAVMRVKPGFEGMLALRAEEDRVYEVEGEGAARNRLFELLDDVLDPGDLVISLDADEQLVFPPTPAMTRNLLGRVECSAFRASYFHLWNREGTLYRADGLWNPDQRAAAWFHVPGARTEEGGLFAESTPTVAREGRINDQNLLTIHHWGYAHLEDRVVKHELYMRRDGGRQHDPSHLRSIVAMAPDLKPIDWERDDGRGTGSVAAVG